MLLILYHPKAAVRNNDSLFKNPALKLQLFCYLNYMENYDLEGIAWFSNTPSQSKLTSYKANNNCVISTCRYSQQVFLQNV